MSTRNALGLIGFLIMALVFGFLSGSLVATMILDHVTAFRGGVAGASGVLAIHNLACASGIAIKSEQVKSS